MDHLGGLKPLWQVKLPTIDKGSTFKVEGRTYEIREAWLSREVVNKAFYGLAVVEIR
jgi:hypothetical protein